MRRSRKRKCRQPDQRRPAAQGLYDPRFEHDACGTGFVAQMTGHKSHTIVEQALTVLENLRHRGAQGAEPNTGDGAGILLQLPDAFFRAWWAERGVELPPAEAYGAGIIFLPQDAGLRTQYKTQLEAIIHAEGQAVIGWRPVPVDNAALGAAALASEPVMEQIFIGRGPDVEPGLPFERKLFVIRRLAEKRIAGAARENGTTFYFASLSTRTIIYKGMLLAEQVRDYFPDLADPRVRSAIALVHSRFSTNTFPSWERAHPYRFLIHNGEINTIKGNANAMRARQAHFRSDRFGEDLAKVLPIIDHDGSDSAMFDNVVEFLTLDGRSLPHAVMMMVPEPWEKNDELAGPRRDFYAFHSAIMEPWDGPASMAFTDGSVVCAVLDRNGLRPSRYYVTDDDLVVMASEVGVLDIPSHKVRQKGRLRPGRMLVVDTNAGQIITDDELKGGLAAAEPYGDWLARHQVTLADLPPASPYPEPDSQTSIRRQQLFGYTFEDLRMILAPMAKNGIEPIGSMGDDSPISVLSERPQLLYNYFRQLFAQVTNPPIDAIREELVTSTTVLLGSEGDLLNPRPEDARRIRLETPLLRNIELMQLREIDRPGFRTAELPILFPPGSGGAGLAAALEELFAAADAAIAGGANLLVLSDRGAGPDAVPIPALLATSGLHQHLVRHGTRTQVSLIVESGEPRETHHFACLIGFGADAINPYLAFETMYDLIERRLLTDVDIHTAVKGYLKASIKGVIKILSKMGISTIQSYHGAQIFEALGLQAEFVDRYFSGTPSRIQGANIDIVAEEAERRHRTAYPARSANGHTLEVGGRFQYREEGEFHLFNPGTVHRLQHAVRTGDYEAYKAYAAAVNDRETHLATLRGLLKLDPDAPSIPLDEVEPEEAILRRFKTGAMSYGSISKEAHEALAIAMNRIGGKSNTGEGGEDTARFMPDENGDSRNSAIKQVASGRFGVTSYYLNNAEEIQIKMAQGAKPGEGGQLPGSKVYPWVAKVRYSTPGVGLISPPPHHDIYSIEDLAQLIYDLKNANPQARINVKLVSEVGVGTIAAGVAKGHADVILISGHDGGTGASPQSSIKHAGLPWELGLAETHQTLVLNNLRSRVRLETDGQLKTGRDVVIAALLGAEEFGFATSPLVAIGCIMMRVCHMDTCPVGIATQNPALRARFTGDPQHVVNFMRFIARETRELMARLGFRTMDEMIGRTDRLLLDQDVGHWKTGQIDLSPLLHQPEVGPEVGRICQIPQQHGLEHSLDETVLLDLCRSALEEGAAVEATLPIRNVHRTVGTILGHHVTKRYGEAGLPEDTIMLTFQGSAGQSFGAFMPRGQTFILEGDANDYLGKGLSGGKIIVKPPAESTFVPEENIITGNVAFYGATSGEAYIRGEAGERFCVRNSGVSAVVEAVGDHGCEYMTGGRVAVLGRTGRNFAAGMSGGVAYVYDPDDTFAARCNTDMVELEPLSGDDEHELNNMVWRHAVYTGSDVAWRMLSDWHMAQTQFVKVMPRDYKRMLNALAEAERQGLTGDEQVMAAFEANRSDTARVSGN